MKNTLERSFLKMYIKKDLHYVIEVRNHYIVYKGEGEGGLGNGGRVKGGFHRDERYPTWLLSS